MTPKGPIHIVMRFSDAFMSVEDTIAEHKSVLAKHGAVWIGKVGRPLGEDHIASINKQISEGKASFLILVQNVGEPGQGDYRAFKGKIVEISKTLPDAERDLVPGYYNKKNIVRTAALWTKLSRVTEMKKGELREYKIRSSGLGLPYALRRSMAAMFIVSEGIGITP